MTLTTLVLAAVLAGATATPKVKPEAQLLAAYLDAQAALAADQLDGARAAAARMESAGKLVGGLASTKESAHAVAVASDLASARAAFKPLSAALALYVEQHAGELPGVILFRCEMAGAVWAQRGEQPRNPYYGAAMAACGERLRPPARN